MEHKTYMRAVDFTLRDLGYDGTDVECMMDTDAVRLLAVISDKPLLEVAIDVIRHRFTSLGQGG